MANEEKSQVGQGGRRDRRDRGITSDHMLGRYRNILCPWARSAPSYPWCLLRFRETSSPTNTHPRHRRSVRRSRHDTPSKKKKTYIDHGALVRFALLLLLLCRLSRQRIHTNPVSNSHKKSARINSMNTYMDCVSRVILDLITKPTSFVTLVSPKVSR